MCYVRKYKRKHRKHVYYPDLYFYVYVSDARSAKCNTTTTSAPTSCLENSVRECAHPQYTHGTPMQVQSQSMQACLHSCQKCEAIDPPPPSDIPARADVLDELSPVVCFGACLSAKRETFVLALATCLHITCHLPCSMSAMTPDCVLVSI